MQEDMNNRMLVMQIDGKINISSPAIVQVQDFFFFLSAGHFLEVLTMTQLLTSQAAGSVQPLRVHLS